MQLTLAVKLSQPLSVIEAMDSREFMEWILLRTFEQYMTFSEAQFTIRAIDKTQKAFTQIGQGIERLDKRYGKLGAGLNRVGALMATAFVGRQFIDVITQFETLEASLKTVTGSAQKASEAFSFIQDFAQTTPFELEEVTDAFIKLKALGLQPSKEALTSYGNTATAMGKSLNQMIEAVADASSTVSKLKCFWHFNLN